MNGHSVFGLPAPTAVVLRDLADERVRQNRLWNREPGRWLLSDEAKLVVLVEEVGEVARAIHDREETDHLREELIQIAAVAVAWAETLSPGAGR